MVDFSQLNKEQEKAVKLIGSPLLIFAGAGSGKTRVLTEKIAYLIEHVGLPPENILSVTFTNKAASEMKERVRKLIKNDITGMTIGTFHSVCASFLRKHINVLGYSNSFTIYDQTDSKQLVKEVIKSLNLDIKTFQPNKYQYLISNFKNKMQYPDDVLLNTHTYIDEKLSDIYGEYNNRLKENNAVDFDDLLLLPIEIFNENKGLLEHYQKKYQYVLVDEYQDTNKPQFEFIYQLSNNNNEVTVVGDDDQSIYAWRGADIENILNFSNLYKDTKIIKLEQNYRSTKVILDAAYNVVSKNNNRADKKIWTDNDRGDLIKLYEFNDERAEASGVINDLLGDTKTTNLALNDIVLLYRTNSQSRAVEDQLRRESIPYHIVGGIKFYDRKEIKDMLAYLKYILNPSDTIAFSRIVNFPARGIGKTTTGKILNHLTDSNKSLSDVMNSLEELGFTDSQIKKINKFKLIIRTLQDGIDGTALELVESLIQEIQLKEYYIDRDNPEDHERLENIDEFISSVADFCDRNDNDSIKDFIEEVSLLTDIDRWNVDEDKLTLMTLHSSKGLEFKNVYILGMEEGLFPLSHGDDDDLEEERRLFYVGLTRAMKKITLSYANSRRRYGSGAMYSLKSSFLDDIPEELIYKNKTRDRKPDFVEKKKSIKILDELSVGDIVEHKLYDKGRILSLEGLGDDAKVTIQFRGNITKKFIKKYANLKKIT